ncbi:hypothetical protein M3Y95_01169700 [Aphelenchoides besseyi]|nr:hypothetical protein M3Y95_01169700 [Aphelenchoides besseyi]
MVVLRVGDRIWVPSIDSTCQLPLGAEVLAVEASGKVTVRDDENQIHELDIETRVRLMDATAIHPPADLIEIVDLHEAAILRTLFVRYKNNDVYSNAGRVLIAINPFEELPIYSKAFALSYSQRRLGELPSHIFATVEDVQQRAIMYERCQSLIFTGETGSGKTKNARYAIEFMTQDQNEMSVQILNALDVIQAFGNACTSSNNNASRLSVNTNIFYDSNGHIDGVCFNTYTLESGRTVRYDLASSNFHVFYSFLENISERERSEFQLTSNPNDYFLLSQGISTKTLSSVGPTLFNLHESLTTCQFSAEDIRQVTSILAILLHFGNLRYKQTVDGVQISDQKQIDLIARLLYVNTDLLSRLLTQQSKTIANEKVTRPLQLTEALNVRDSLIKNIYGGLLSALVQRLNVQLNTNSVDNDNRRQVSVVDSRGFESLHHNRFDQLVANFTNEALYHTFVRNIKLEQAQYDSQKIGWIPLELEDNFAVVDLLAAERIGLLRLIETESEDPQSSDSSLLRQFDVHHGENSSAYAKPAVELSRVFGVRHFVGPAIRYTTGDWVDNRRDFLGDAIQQLSRTSDCNWLRVIAKLPKRAPIDEVDELIKRLETSQTNFVRCIRPNRQAKSKYFDRSVVFDQMRSFDLIGTVRFEAAAFPVCNDYTSFVDRFRGLVPGIEPSNRTDCVHAAGTILSVILGVDADFRLGKTRVFMKNTDFVALEREREKMRDYYATTIQKHTRGILQRRRFEIMRKSTICIQRAWRSAYQRSRYSEILKGINRLQATLRAQQLVVNLATLRQNIVRKKMQMSETDDFQAIARGFLFRQSIVSLETLAEFRTAMAPDQNDVKENEHKTSEHESQEECPFEKYAVVHFEPVATSTYSRQSLSLPLLRHENGDDHRSSILLSVQIRRFMSDLNENSDDTTLSNAPSITSNDSEINEQPTANWVKTVNERSDKRNWLKESASEIELVQSIVGHGILRSNLRDEIYAQILSQLNDKKRQNNIERGYLLLSICAGCFLPSKELLIVVRQFLKRTTSTESAEFINYRFDRCELNGVRRQPPARTELDAIKRSRPLNSEVTLTNGERIPIEIDSSKSAREICIQVSKAANLSDRFGFALFVTMENGWIASLGAGNDLVCDAISECEQRSNAAAPVWRLFFRKEIFSPWTDADCDRQTVEIVYCQIIRGVYYGELKANNDELASLAATQFYVRQSGRPTVDIEELDQHLSSLLPEAKHKSLEPPLKNELWLQRILNIHRKKFAIDRPPTVAEAQKEVVTFAASRWPLQFSRFFEVFKFSGPPLEENVVVLAVNSEGIFVLAENTPDRVLLEWKYSEIVGIVAKLSKYQGADAVTISILNGDEFTFQSGHAADIRDLVVFFIDGLRRRSSFRLLSETPSRVHDFCAGDLLRIVEQEPSTSKSTGQWMENTRTGKTAYIPAELMIVIPTISLPSKELLKKLRQRLDIERPMSPKKTVTKSQSVVPVLRENSLDLVPIREAHSLRFYAAEHFRPSNRELWRHDQYPLDFPLLHRLIGQPEVCELAITSFVAILRFMGDWPTVKPCDLVELTDAIFGPPIRFEALRDETYCQLLKQLTNNPNPMSEERGWRLLWLTVGLWPPSKKLHLEITKFLRARYSSQTAECVERLNQTVRMNVERKCPPHRVEVEAINSSTTRLFHKVFLPNGSEHAVEVKSGSKVVDLCVKLGQLLGFKSTEGFSLFIRLGNKVISMPESEYFFDQIAQISKWIQSNFANKLPTTMPSYQILFMRKLWIDVKTGEDPAMDVFHYHQEVPKILRGYHKIDKTEAVQLAALILRAQTRDNKQPPWQHFQQHILFDLVPKNLVKSQSTNEWKKQIASQFKMIENESSNEAKLQLMKIISRWPTFGASFFEVKQTSDPTMPTQILLAISQRGLTIYNRETNEQIAHHSFDSIINFTSGNTYFHITRRGGRLLVETTLGYKLDDLLASYIRVLHNQMSTS